MRMQRLLLGNWDMKRDSKGGSGQTINLPSVSWPLRGTSEMTSSWLLQHVFKIPKGNRERGGQDMAPLARRKRTDLNVVTSQKSAVGPST